jgi:hypothetical protein
MAATNIRFYARVVAAFSSLLTKQLGICSAADADLGYKMLGYKDGDGTARQVLCKDQPIKITTAAATTDTDKFLVNNADVIKYRTGAEVLSDIGGAPIAETFEIVTTTTTISKTLTVCNSATAFTCTLPAASGTGIVYKIKSINTADILIEGNGSDTIDGELNQTIGQWDCIIVQDYAANKWVII